ncbi:MAG: BrnT family toxin [Nitrospira sp.]|nr:BrnT family toxin [Nitrospira sp.]
MDFEFDVAKSKANREKHGIDFIEAQGLWEDEDRLEIPARTEDEPRYVLIAVHKQKLWSAFFTYRKGRIRLISARRSRTEERALYYESQESREDV